MMPYDILSKTAALAKYAQQCILYREHTKFRNSYTFTFSDNSFTALSTLSLIAKLIVSVRLIYMVLFTVNVGEE